MPEEAKQQGAPPHWLGYVAVPSVDETLAQAEGLGGKKLMGPMDIPTVGRTAVIQDPQGAVLAIYTSPDDAPGHDGEPAIGEFSWHELYTSDYVLDFDFYSALFGWVKTESMEMGPGNVYQMYGRSMGGMMTKPAEMPGPPYWLYYVNGPRRAREDRPGDAARRAGAQRSNGGAGRRHHRAVHGSTGRCVRPPLEETVRLRGSGESAYPVPSGSSSRTTAVP